MKQINFNDAKHFDYVHIFSTAITHSFIFMVSILKVLVSVTTLPPPPFFSPFVCLQILQICLLFSLNPCILQQKKSMELHNYLSRKPLYLQVLDSTSEQL